jgi:hypothetical protein
MARVQSSKEIQNSPNHSLFFPYTPLHQLNDLRPQLVVSPRGQFNHDMGMVRSPPPHNHLNPLAQLQTRLHRRLALRKIRHPSLLPRLSPHIKSPSSWTPTKIAPRPVLRCLVIDKPGEYVRFPLRMMFRMTITWILSPLFPLDVGRTRTYPCMLLAWSITGLFRNFQRTWRETHLIGGWQSNSLSLYISLVYLRFPPSHPLTSVPGLGL